MGMLLVCAAIISASFMLPPAGAADNCGAQFTDKNAPDDTRCTFSCKAGQILTIGVDASDSDATASGSARCGGGYSPCRTSAGKNSCYGEDGIANSDSGSGTCSAVVDELYNSAWSYNCAVRDPKVDCPSPPCGGRPPDCIFGIVCCPPALCGATTAPSVPQVDPCSTEFRMSTPELGFSEDPALPGSESPGLESRVCDGTTSNSAAGLPAGTRWRVDVWVVGEAATGRLCVAGKGCWPIEPACQIDQLRGHATCTVGSSTKILGAVAPSGGER